MYKFSTDYSRLHELLVQGNDAIGFVTLGAHTNVCRIIREGDWTIDIFARGVTYRTVRKHYRQMPAHPSHGKTEKESFINACNSCNLEWIEPHLDSDNDQLRGITSMSVKPFEKFSLYDESIITTQTDRTTPIKRMAECITCNYRTPVEYGKKAICVKCGLPMPYAL